MGEKFIPPKRTLSRPERTLRGGGDSLRPVDAEFLASMGGPAESWRESRQLTPDDMGMSWLKAQKGGYSVPWLDEDSEGGNLAYLQSLGEMAKAEGWEGMMGEVPDERFVARSLLRRKKGREKDIGGMMIPLAPFE